MTIIATVNCLDIFELELLVRVGWYVGCWRVNAITVKTRRNIQVKEPMDAKELAGRLGIFIYWPILLWRESFSQIWWDTSTFSLFYFWSLPLFQTMHSSSCWISFWCLGLWFIGSWMIKRVAWLFLKKCSGGRSWIQKPSLETWWGPFIQPTPTHSHGFSYSCFLFTIARDSMKRDTNWKKFTK